MNNVWPRILAHEASGLEVNTTWRSKELTCSNLQPPQYSRRMTAPDPVQGSNMELTVACSLWTFDDKGLTLEQR